MEISSSCDLQIRFLKSTGSRHISSCNVLRLSRFYNPFEFLAGKCFQTVVDLFRQNTFLLSFLARTVFYLLVCSTKQEISHSLKQICFNDVPAAAMKVTDFIGHYFSLLCYLIFFSRRETLLLNHLLGKNKQTNKQQHQIIMVQGRIF